MKLLRTAVFSEEGVDGSTVSVQLIPYVTSRQHSGDTSGQ